MIRLTLVRALQDSGVVGVEGNFYSFSAVLWVSNRRAVCGVRSLKSDNQLLLASFEIMVDWLISWVSVLSLLQKSFTCSADVLKS